ncbi:MAG: tRNA pseudouridine(38-40) synthase TruA [Candidatus Omnitrophica bacterium]|nr:tRNA pseudouridine(38-40) synthase TruA [Candidatus Omnitrophota bacterium]
MKQKSLRFKAVITYDGSDFSGWQIQPGKKTIQEEIEKVLSRIFQKRIKIQSSGRTDSGVHATKHVISFALETDMRPEQIRKAMNALLDKHIRVKNVSIASESFHPRFDAKKKIYRYLLTGFNSPFLLDRAWYIPEKICISRMKEAASFIAGTQDFSCFQASGRKAKNTVRTIEYIKIKKEYFCFDPDVSIISIEICGTGFLYKMARNIVGTLVDAGRKRIEPEQIKRIIASKDRRLASPTAPAYGLYLKNVIYE